MSRPKKTPLILGAIALLAVAAYLGWDAMGLSSLPGPAPQSSPESQLESPPDPRVVEPSEGDERAPQQQTPQHRSPQHESSSSPGRRATTQDPAGSSAPASLRGRLVDRLDVPVREARVRLYARSAELQTAEAQSDRLGRFELRAPAGVGYALRIEHPDFATPPLIRHLVLRATRPCDVGTVRLAAGQSLIGRVLLPSGRGQSGVLVRLEPELAPFGGPIAETRREAVSDSIGRFAIHGLAERAYRLTLIPPAPYARQQHARVQPGSETRDYTLQAGTPLRAVVRDASGAWFEGAELRLYHEDGGSVPARSGAAGQLVVEGLAPGSWDYALRAAPFAPELRGRFRLPREELLELQLPRAPTLRLRIVAARPLPSVATLQLSPESNPLEVHEFAALPVRSGMLTLEGLDEGPWVGVLKVAGFAPAHLSSFRVDRGERRIELEIEASLRGVVQGERGAAAPGLHVLVQRPSAARPGLLIQGRLLGRAQTDAKGQFELTGLPAGRCEILLGSAPETAQRVQSLELQAGREQRLELRWPPGDATIVIRIAPELALPVEVLLRPSDGGPAQRRRFSTAREQRVEGLRPGRFTVHRVGAEFRPELVQARSGSRVVVVVR
jgi:hypothetical protein